MERKKKASALVVAFGLLGVLLVSIVVQMLSPDAMAKLPESSQAASLAPPTPIPGVTYTGMYIRIGLNDGGTFGWTPTVVPYGTPGTGFQFPIGAQYESLAIYWWGEGYVVAYKVKTAKGWVDNIAFWWPELGWPPPAVSRIVPVYAKQLRNDTNRAIREVRVQTVDKVLNITFKFSFPKPQKYVLLETKITNNGVMGEVRDVLYKRIVDWDVHKSIMNMWTNDAHAAYATFYNRTLDRYIEMSVSGYTSAKLTNAVSYVDLFAWDDIQVSLIDTKVTTRHPGTMDIQSHNMVLPGDGNAAVYYDLGNMAARTTKAVITVYQAGWHGQYIPEYQGLGH